MINPLRSLSTRLLLFNILILFLPLGSLLLLDTYENQLLAFQENSMIQQGRILSAALAGLGAEGQSAETPAEDMLAAGAARILENLKARVDSRLRVVDRRGRLLADSSRLNPREDAEAARTAAYADETRGQRSSANESLLYRVAVYPLNFVKKLFFPPQAGYSSAEYYSGSAVLMGPEILAALEGRYGAATRISTGEQASVTLYSAIPIEGNEPGEISGAVLVSRSSYGILLNLYRLRLDIIKIFLISIAISLALSLGLSLTITAPIKKLKHEAERVLDKSGHFQEHFRGQRRADEIGDLSRSLGGLSQKLEKRIAFIDAFISDLLHELKNPMAAIRGQTELAIAAPEKEAKLLEGIRQEEVRMERLLARLGELSRIDNTLEGEETGLVDLAELLPAFAESRSGGDRIVYDAPGESGPAESGLAESGPAMVRANTDRLIQALRNPLDNAVSFSPPGGTIRLGLRRAQTPCREWRITIDDEGPGVREGSGERCFERFYSERPEPEKENHSGLGLAIVRAIATGYGGSCGLENRYNEAGSVTGCRFTLVLPAAAEAG
jgi:two-component system sensor histidine kinase ChvG